MTEFTNSQYDVNPVTGEMRRQPTFGEQLVGLDFNPSGDPKVQRAKELCAELANLVKPEMNATASPLKRLLSEQAIGEILNAQMNVVKVLTFKY
jgi:hypothetical protein